MNKKKHHLKEQPIFILMWLLFFCLCPLVFAEQPAAVQDEELFEMSIEELMEVEVGTVTTASKYEQKTTEAPSSVTVITAEEIELYGYRTLADVLRSAKGFYTSYDRSFERVGVRGFSLPGDVSTRTLILIDGNRMNDNIRGHGAIGNDFLLDTALIKRIEIIRGPGSSLYGSNAIFAVINIITKQGKDFEGFEVSTDFFGLENSLRRWETGRTRVTFGKEFEDGTDFLISSTLFDRDATKLIIPHFSTLEDLGPTYYDDENVFSIFTKLGFEDWTIEAGLNSRDKEVPTAPLGAWFEQKSTKKNDSGFIQATYNHTFENEMSMMLRNSLNFHNYEEELMYDGFPTIFEYDGMWLNNEIQFTAEPFEKHKLTWGAEFQFNLQQDMDFERLALMEGLPDKFFTWEDDNQADVETETDLWLDADYWEADWTQAYADSLGEGELYEEIYWAAAELLWREDGTAGGGMNWSPGTVISDEWKKEVHKNSWAVYVQDEYKMTEDITLNAGIRYDYYEGAGGTTNPRVALIDQLSDRTTLKLMYGTAFRAPTIYETHYYNEPLEAYEPALNLKSETIETYEAVLEHYFNPSTRGSLSLFHYNMLNYIAQESAEGWPPGGLAWDNRSQIKAVGLEAGLEKKWKNGTKGRFSYSFVDTKHKETHYGDEVFTRTTKLPNSPMHMLKGNLIVPLIENKLFAGIEAQYYYKRSVLSANPEFDQPFGDHTDDYWLTNLTLTWKDVVEGMNMSFGVYNLFDEEYAHPAWGDNELSGIEQNGRTFMMNLKYRF